MTPKKKKTNRSRSRPEPGQGRPKDGRQFARCRAAGCLKLAMHYPRARVWAQGASKVTTGSISAILAYPLCLKCAEKGGSWFSSEHRAKLWKDASRGRPMMAPFDWATADFSPVSILTGEHPHDRNPTDSK